MLRVPLAGLKAQSNTTRSFVLKERSTFDRVVGIDVIDDGFDLLGRYSPMFASRELPSD